jgi:hypothetical protein
MTAFPVVRGRRVLYWGAAPGLVPPVPLNLTEASEGNEELRGPCGLLLESRAVTARPLTRDTPYTRRTLTADDFRPSATFGWPFGPHLLYSAPYSI